MTELTQLELALDATDMGKWKTYPSYKDSGVEWLGEIPAHWEVWKISRTFSLIGSGTTPLTSHEEYYDGDIPWVNTTELKDGVIIDTAKKLTRRAMLDYPTLRLYPAGTLLVALYGATIGKVGVLQIPATTNQACCAVFNSKHLIIDFTFYWFVAFRQQLILLASGGGQPNISQDTIRSLRIPTPPLPEQRAIATFLDRETSKINTLIAKKERLIKLLQEKRAALISDAVTKGLDPDVKVKDSGVEWLGEIPAHWEIAPLYARYSIQLGKMRDQEQITGLTLAPYLRNVNIQWDYVDTADILEMDFDQTERRKYALKYGDLLVCEGGEVGRTAIWRDELPECYIQKAVHRVRPLNHNEEGRFLFYVFYMVAHQGVFESGVNRSTIGHLTSEKLKKYRFMFPPLSEQCAIVNFLDRETSKINALISRIGEAIEKLKEYSAALISAAVTGKIDLRGEVAMVGDES